MSSAPISSLASALLFWTGRWQPELPKVWEILHFRFVHCFGLHDHVNLVIQVIMNVLLSPFDQSCLSVKKLSTSRTFRLASRSLCKDTPNIVSILRSQKLGHRGGGYFHSICSSLASDLSSIQEEVSPPVDHVCTVDFPPCIRLSRLFLKPSFIDRYQMFIVM